LPFFELNLIVVTITSNSGRCSALVLTNTSKRLDLYQHKASMQLTASNYVPQLV